MARSGSVRLAVAAAVFTVVVLAATIDAHGTDRDALWEIVHDECVVNQRRSGDPEPCAMVGLGDGAERGYALLKDRSGRTQFLLIPTARISGIEDPVLLAPDAPNYFAAAWQARSYVEARIGHALPREDVSLAINSALARSQDQLHIHIDCLRADVRDKLRGQAPRIGRHWAPLGAPLAGRDYMAMRVLGADLGQANPFDLLAGRLPGAREDMRMYTLVVAGARFADEGPGFVVLAHRADSATGDRGGGEALQDHACGLAGGGAAARGSTC